MICYFVDGDEQNMEEMDGAQFPYYFLGDA